MQYNSKDIKDLSKVKRLRLINAITGIKPANLIGTKSLSGQSNVAIFSSVVHLGSNPPLLGFIVRPTGEIPRHTFTNIINTKYYTINHVTSNFIKNAHYTSAKFDSSMSEFEKCQLTEEYIDDFHAPFVKESVIKIGLQFQESVPINLNNTILVIGKIEYIDVPDAVLNDSNDIDLEDADSVGISGLNHYYKLKKVETHPYARVDELPDFD